MRASSRPAAFRGGAALTFIALLAVWALSSCATIASQPERPVFRLGVIGDQTGTHDLGRAYGELEKGVEQLRGFDLDAVIHVGDLLESAKPVPAIKADFEKATGLLDRLAAPWFLTAGDHDVNPPLREANSADRSREAVFLELYRGKKPGIAGTPYYAVTVNGWQLISLYSHEHLHSDPRWGKIFFARISDRQFAWLKDVLAGRRPETHGTIVFIHQPLWYNWGDWSRVHALLAEHGVLLVVAGHFHYSQDDGELDGIRYLVHGATGGRIKATPAALGGAHLVSVLEISAAEIMIRSVSTDGEGLTGFARRNVMDRVQSLEVSLGHLASSLGQASVYRRSDGALSGRCDPGLPGAGHMLEPFANPVDRSVRISLSVPDEPDVVLSVRGADCASSTVSNGTAEVLTCDLPPGFGVMVSNLSSVGFQPMGPETPVLTIGGTTRSESLDISVRIETAAAGTQIEAQEIARVSIAECPLAATDPDPS